MIIPEEETAVCPRLRSEYLHRITHSSNRLFECKAAVDGTKSSRRYEEAPPRSAVIRTVRQEEEAAETSSWRERTQAGKQTVMV